MPKSSNRTGGELKSRKKLKVEKKTSQNRASAKETDWESDVEEDENQDSIYSDDDGEGDEEARWETPPNTKKKEIPVDEGEVNHINDARAEFRKDPAVIEAHRQYNDFINKSNNALRGSEKETADKARIYVNLLVAIEERIFTYYKETQGGTLPAGTECYHITTHRTQRALDLGKNEVMRAIRNYLGVLVVDMVAAHPDDDRYVMASMRESFPLNQDPQALAEGLMERANKETLEAPLKEITMALARDLGKKANHYLDPEELSRKLSGYFNEIRVWWMGRNSSVNSTL